MAATLGTARHVVKVIDALNIEWNLIATFNKSQISPWIMNLG
jgi:hypothetical protein